MCMCVVFHYRVIPWLCWPQVIYLLVSWWCDLGIMYILFRDIFIWYFSCVIIFVLSVIVFIWCVLHSLGIDSHSFFFDVHPCVADIHSCDFHFYCCIFSTYGYVILYRVQYFCFFGGYHSWYLIYSVAIHFLFFINNCRVVGSVCGGGGRWHRLCELPWRQFHLHMVFHILCYWCRIYRLHRYYYNYYGYYTLLQLRHIYWHRFCILLKWSRLFQWI